ncbi:optineurin isoform X2 [Latimeria chalumnae]|uniref:optineurin isoform X2 n=1 Tax=Latimeria chalumnae TaxID=7897 RepID=UPI00313D6312
MSQEVNGPTLSGEFEVLDHGAVNGAITSQLDVFTPEETLQQIQELIKENGELKEAVKQTNQAMKERYDELSAWRGRQKEEREFLERKFQEAKEKLLALTKENEELKKTVQIQEEKHQKPIQDEAVKEAVEQDVEQLKALVVRLQAEKADLVAMNSELQVKLGAESPEDSFVQIRIAEREENEEMKATRNVQNQLSDPAAVFTSKFTDETKCCLDSEELTVSQLLHLLREETQKAEKLETDLQCANERVSHLEKKVVYLLEKGTQTEWNTEDQDHSDQRKEMEATAVTKQVNEVETLKQQVLSLFKELQEAHVKLDEAELMKKTLQENCQALERKVSSSHSDMEEMQQLQYTNDKLKLQVDSTQSEIRMEQMKTAEEKRKLAQLQVAYTQLYSDYTENMKEIEALKRKESELVDKAVVHDLSAKLELAEKALVTKQQRIDEMKQTVAKQEEEMETVGLLKAQIEVYCSDFHAERAAREKIHEEKEKLAIQLEYMKKENSNLKDDLIRLGRPSIVEMQRRHGAQGPSQQDNSSALVHRGPNNCDWQHQGSIPEFACPKCAEILPDIDTLQIHVMDCII